MDYSFRQFFAIHAKKQKWKVPVVHLNMIDFMDDEDRWGNDTKTLLCFRGIGKSTITDLWIAYMLSKNPKLRFLVLSADKTTAKRTSKDVLFIIRTHPLCSHLLTTDLEVQQDRFYVKGSNDPRNPSVSAYGILSNVTSARADYIIFDDVEVKRNSGVDGKREDLRMRVAEANNLLNPDIGRRLFIGTYHDVKSIYDEEISNGSELMKIPLLTKKKGEYPYMSGESSWPDRFDDAAVEKIQKNTMNRAEWRSQYLLIPDTVADTLLDPTLLIQYEHDLVIRFVNKQAYAKLGEFNIKSASMWWDPALSGKKRDDSVLSLVLQDEDGNMFIHRVWNLVGGADHQCELVKKYALEFEAPSVAVEKNGVGAFLPQLLRKALRGVGIGVDEQHTSRNKKEKIVSAFETPLSAGVLFAHISVFDSPLYSQLTDFGPNFSGKDDYMDSVASASLHEPVRLGTGGSWDYAGETVTHWMGTEGAQLKRDYALGSA